MARPKSKYTDDNLEKIRIKMEKYTDDTAIPILKEFCIQERIPSNHIYDFPVLTESIKRLVDKKEVNLEKLGLANKIDRVMAIFSLKQLGWKDKQEITHDIKEIPDLIIKLNDNK